MAAICRSLVRLREVRPEAMTLTTTRRNVLAASASYGRIRLGEGRLDDLEAKLAVGAFLRGCSRQRSDAQLTEGDRRDPLLLRQVIRIEPVDAELDDDAGVQQPRRGLRESRGRVQPRIDELVELFPEAAVVLTTEPPEGAEHVGLLRRNDGHGGGGRGRQSEGHGR